MFSDAPFGSFLRFSDQVQIRATALRSYDSLRLTRFDSALVAGPVAYLPSGAGPGTFLCRFFGFVFVLCLNSWLSLFPVPLTRTTVAGFAGVSALHAPAGLVVSLSLFSCLCLDGHTVLR